MTDVTAGLYRNLVQRVNVADCVRRNAALYGDKFALIDAHRSMTYADLHGETNAVATALLGAGIGRGDFVALLFRNYSTFVVTYLACARIGAVSLPLNPHLTSADQAAILAESKPKALVALGDYVTVAARLANEQPSIELLIVANDKDGKRPPLPVLAGTAVVGFDSFAPPRVGDVEVEVEDRDPVQCLYTSGTTATPKGVLTSHLAAVFTSLSAAHHGRLTAASTSLSVMPIHHVGGLNNVTLPHLVVGATVLLVDGWDAERVAELVERNGITDLLLTAPMWLDLLSVNRDQTYDWSSLKTCLVGVASLAPERGEELRKRCPNADLLLVSGQTEFTGYEEGQRPEHQFTKALAWGDPTLMTDIGIMDEGGRLLGPNETGEIVYRGPQAMSEYFAHPELTRDAFEYGWFHSGDLGYLDEDHCVFFVDRKKDMIKTGGENVASIEVAHAILGHPAVVDCAVVGLPHPRWTEAVTAFVRLTRPNAAGEEELLAFCRTRLAGFKIPKRVIVVDEFPKTASGKIQKVALREAYANLFEFSDP